MIGSIKVRNSLGRGGEGEITYCSVFLDYIMRLEGLKIGRDQVMEGIVRLSHNHSSAQPVLCA